MNELKTGTVLQGGKYRIERVLGQGGFGITYMATQIALNRKVAIKEFFMKELCNRDNTTSQVSVPSIGSQDIVDRFRAKFVKEAQTIATLDNPHIIRIYDIFTENGTAYYVMDYIGGGSLTNIVEQDGPMSESVAISFIRQIGDALSYIHARHINHLDIKPSNILVGNNEQAVVIDFGLSKRYDATGSQTSSTPVGISHGFAPLEQYQPGGVSTFSPSTDIYSLGATLYKLLSAQTPPNATILIDSDLDLSSLPNTVSTSTKAAISASMQPKRKDRPQSVERFLNMLANNTEKKDTILNSKPETDECTVLAAEAAKSFKAQSQELKNNNQAKLSATQKGRKTVEEVRGKKGAFFKSLTITGLIIVCALGYFKFTQHHTATNELTAVAQKEPNGPGDLGLSVKWSTINLGAIYDYDLGYYTAFEPIFNAVDTSFLKSMPFPESPEYFNDPNHDPVVKYLGNGWRLPFESEMSELIEKCKWTWIMKNGIEGAKVTGPNGNSIFLPASGVYDDYAGWGGKWRDKNKTGFYLTKSMVLRNDSVGHYRLMFSEKNRGVYVGCENSFFMAVRPVKDY